MNPAVLHKEQGQISVRVQCLSLGDKVFNSDTVKCTCESLRFTQRSYLVRYHYDSKKEKRKNSSNTEAQRNIVMLVLRYPN